MRIRDAFSGLVAFGLVTTPAGASAQEDGAARAAASITAEDLHHRVGVLAHDSMRGRMTPSPELDQAAEWIGQELAGLGLSPGGDDGTFIQRYSVRHVVPDLGVSSVKVVGGPELLFGRDVGLPYGPGGTGDYAGPVVLITGSRNWDQRLYEATLRGSHVMIIPGTSQSLRSPEMRVLFRAIAETNPASIWFASDRSDEEWGRDVALQAERSRLTLGLPSEDGPARLAIRDRALQSLLETRGFDVAQARSDFDGEVSVTRLEDLHLTLSLRNRVIEEQEAPNVVGVLEGSDPELKDEYVVLSAHMDHVGVGRSDALGDSIYNGADDDASGTAAILEIAEAFAALPGAPRRSTVFLLVSGEERGLWGSRVFAERSPITSSAVANLNLDMVGRNWPDTIVVIGREHSDLGETLERVSAHHPELGMSAIDDLWPEQDFYSRSDHFNFARKGVPILFFFNGTHADYHRPSDELASIDAEKAARIAKLVFYLGLEVANADEPPRWNPESYRSIVVPSS